VDFGEGVIGITEAVEAVYDLRKSIVGVNCVKKYKRTLYRQVQRALPPVVDPAQIRSQLSKFPGGGTPS